MQIVIIEIQNQDVLVYRIYEDEDLYLGDRIRWSLALFFWSHPSPKVDASLRKRDSEACKRRWRMLSPNPFLTNYAGVIFKSWHSSRRV